MQQTHVCLCRFLRTKEKYICGDESWRIDEPLTDNYWCLKTMTTVGPDDHFVAPEQCDQSRDCYSEIDVV